MMPGNRSSRRSATAFTNRISVPHEERFPGIMVETLVYQFSRRPPKLTLPRRNVMPCFCTYEAEFAHPLAESDYEENVAIVKDLREWGRRTSHLFVWDYATTYTKDSRGYPFPSEWHLADKYRFYATHGVHGIFWEHEDPDHTDLYDLKFYFMTKLFENPNLDYPAFFRRTFSEYYGATAGPLVSAARERLRDAL